MAIDIINQMSYDPALRLKARFMGGGSAQSAAQASSTAQQNAQRASLFQRAQNFLNRRVPVPQGVANFLAHPIQSLVGLTALPLVGGVGAFGAGSAFENVAQTIGKGAAYTPFPKLFSGDLGGFAKQYAAVAGTTAVTSDVLRNTFNYYTGKPIDLMPTKGELIFSGLAGASPFGHIVGITGAGLYNAAKFLGMAGKKAGSAIGGTAQNTGADLAQFFDKGAQTATNAFKEGFGAAQGLYDRGMSSLPSEFPTIPVSVSMPGLGGGIGMGLDIAGILAALGGGYLLGKRKKKKSKRKKYKHSRRKK